MEQYNEYLKLIRELNDHPLHTSNFKSHGHYRGVLEHVTEGVGRDCLKSLEHKFPQVDIADVVAYTQKNDRIGSPDKSLYLCGTGDQGTELLCSPSSLRYAYHALLILQTIYEQQQEKTKRFTRIVELGCGYGGLYLAIIHFQNKYFPDVNIEHYYFVDLPDVIVLIGKYLEEHNIPTGLYSLVDTFTYGKEEIPDCQDENDQLFFVSNYCFTELTWEWRQKYYELLLPKCGGGFIIWQSIVTPLSEMERLPLPSQSETEEPQTSPASPNYFVRF